MFIIFTMSYRRLYSFKTGISPSLLDSFPTDGKYSGTQKLLLIRTRIFGDKIGYILCYSEASTPQG